MEKRFYTYLWLREDGIPYYVGKGSGYRAFTSLYHGVHKPTSSARIIVQNWGTEQEALDIEKWYISLFGRKDLGTGCLRNLTDGGENPPNMRGIPLTEEHKKKISLSLKGKPKSKDHNRKNSEVRKGKKLTETHKENIGKSHKGLKYLKMGASSA